MWRWELGSLEAPKGPHVDPWSHLLGLDLDQRFHVSPHQEEADCTHHLIYSSPLSLAHPAPGQSPAYSNDAWRSHFIFYHNYVSHFGLAKVGMRPSSNVSEFGSVPGSWTRAWNVNKSWPFRFCRPCFLAESWLPRWLSWQRIHLQCRRPWFDSWGRNVHWRRDRLPTPVFLGRII